MTFKRCLSFILFVKVSGLLNAAPFNQEAAAKWYRDYVQNWNEWQRKKALPEHAKKEPLLTRLFESTYGKGAPLLAKTSQGVVSFSLENKSTQRLEIPLKKAGISKQKNLLTLRVVRWPRVLINGNVFEYVDNKPIEVSYDLLKKEKHYQNLTNQNEKDLFTLAALDYMTAVRKASAELKSMSSLRLQKPKAKGAVPEKLVSKPNK